VPEELRTLVGKREEKRSLQTRDPLESKRRHAEALVASRAGVSVSEPPSSTVRGNQKFP
jgi:hypothetical protein